MKLAKKPAAYLIEYRDGSEDNAADARRRGEGFQLRGAREGHGGSSSPRNFC